MTKKRKAKVLVDNPRKEMMEEDLKEEALMDEDSPPRRAADAGMEEEDFPHYVQPRRADVEEVTLPKKASTFLVSPWIPNYVPLLMNLMPKISRLAFEYIDTRLQFGLEISNYMTTNQARPTQVQVLVPMQWATSVSNTGLLDMLFMPHFGHSL